MSDFYYLPRWPHSKFRKEECPHCEDGRKWVSKYGGNDPDVWAVTCDECDGTGKIEVEYEVEDED